MSMRRTFAAALALLMAAFAAGAQDTACPVTIDWQRRTDMPKAVGGAAFGPLGGVLIAAGGTTWIDETQKLWLPDAYAYDAATDKWGAIPAMPRTAGYPCAVSFRDAFYVFGGQTAKEVNTAETLRLRKAGEIFQWEPFVALPEKLANMQPALVDSTVFLVAGDAGEGAPTPNNHIWKIDLAAATPEWKSCAPLPGPNRTGVATAVCGGKVYAFGGDIVSAFCYDPVLDRWEPLPDLPFPTYWSWAVSWQDRYIILPGGFVSKPNWGAATSTLHMDENGFVSDVLVYDTATGRYSFSTPLPKGIIDYGLARVADRIHLVGGEDRGKHRESWFLTGVLSIRK
jgi:N-acetylneuraminic acid mutarotase